MSKKEKVLAVCDVLFVLVLCFAVLLATMLLTSSGEEKEMQGYVVSMPVLCAVTVSIAGYLIYMIKTSLSDLKKMIAQAETEGGLEG